MFERTVSLWRRLMHPGDDFSGTAAVEEDRRSAVRFPADGQVRYQMVTANEPAGRQARVRNISVNGVNLLADHECAPGELLNIHLEGGAGAPAKSVLACVVHVSAEEEGTWSLGCTFARGLAIEDLQPFTENTIPALRVEQRARPRFTCAVSASYQRVGQPAGEVCPATVLNISTTGVGLVVREPLTPGTLLNVTLGPARQVAAQTMLSCVVHMSDHQEGEWALGCNFITELRERDLKLLL